MNDRVLLNEFVINRQQFYPRDTRDVLHLFDTPNRIINNKEPENYISKNLNDNLNNIHEIEYVIVPNTTLDETSSETNDDINTNSIKVSTIEQKEYLINISNFRTFVNPANEIFYTQNTFYKSTLTPKLYETTIHKKKWSMGNRFL